MVGRPVGDDDGKVVGCSVGESVLTVTDETDTDESDARPASDARLEMADAKLPVDAAEASASLISAANSDDVVESVWCESADIDMPIEAEAPSSSLRP